VCVCVCVCVLAHLKRPPGESCCKRDSK